VHGGGSKSGHFSTIKAKWDAFLGGKAKRVRSGGDGAKKLSRKFHPERFGNEPLPIGVVFLVWGGERGGVAAVTQGGVGKKEGNNDVFVGGKTKPDGQGTQDRKKQRNRAGWDF